MSTDSVQADNITMSAGGLYSLATIGAKDVIDKSIPLVLDSLADVPQGDLGFWNFSDMGCADGGTSLGLWRAVVSRLREHDASDIQVVYADQAFNDFNALVQILHGHTSFHSYVSEHPAVHVLQSGSSFYSPIVAANSLHLGFSATAMHWLSQKPCDIDEHIHMVGASGKQATTFADAAAKDWQNILMHRARELRPGGSLVLVNFCRDEQGQYLGNTGGINMFHQFNANWQSFVDNGDITQREYQAMTLPQYYNTVDEFCAPLQDTSSEVYKAGLRLVDIHTAVVPCPFAENFKQHQDATRFAADYIPTIRSWNESIFMGALASTRTQTQRQELITAFYDLYEQQVRETPQGHGMGYVHAYMQIKKI